MSGLYLYIDRPLIGLAAGDRLIAWSLRSWGEAQGAGRPPAEALAPAYAGFGLSGAVAALDRAAAILTGSARAGIAFPPLAAPCVGEDEALLLALWRDLAQGRAVQARATIAEIVVPDMAGALFGAICRHAAALVVAGLAPGGVPRPNEENEHD